MMRTMLKSKLHGGTVTQAELHYEGSITIDGDLMEQGNIIENERVQVVNLANGARLETYVITGAPGSGIICLNGPAARLCAVGDALHILSYVSASDDELVDYQPTILLLGEGNRVKSSH
jgi:aspartate 1-decarboxylase